MAALQSDHQILLEGKRDELVDQMRKLMEVMGEPWHGTIPSSWDVKVPENWKAFDDHHTNIIILRQDIEILEKLA